MTPQKDFHPRMLAKEIFKRLVYAFLITLVISITYSWARYESTTGNELRQAMFMFVIITFMQSVLNFILSLTAFLNLYPAIRKSSGRSLAAFIFLPGAACIWLLILLLTGNERNETITGFLDPLFAPLLFIAALVYQFYLFRKTTGRLSV